MKFAFRILAVVALLLVFSGVAVAQTEGEGGGVFTIPNPLKCGNDPNLPPVQDCLSRLIQGLIMVSVPIVVVMVIIGAYQFLTSSGSPEKVSNARKTIVYAAVGFAIILMAQALVFILRDILGGGSGNGVVTPPAEESQQCISVSDCSCPFGTTPQCITGYCFCG